MTAMYERLEEQREELYDEEDDLEEDLINYNEQIQNEESEKEQPKLLSDGEGAEDKHELLHLSEMPKPPIRKAPDLPQIERRNWLLHHHFVRKEMSTCKALIKEQLDETSDLCEYALYLKGIILRQEGKIQESLDIFQQCAILNSRNVDYVKQIARSLFLLGKQKSALDVFNEALKLNEQDWEIHYWKGLSYYHIRDYTNAKESLQRALKFGKHERIFVLLGKIFTEEGDLMNAIEAYRRGLEASPENPDILTQLGLLYLQTDSSQQAFEALGRALSFDPSHAGAILAAGSMMQQHADYDVALTKYRVAAQEMPDSAQLWSNIAMCFYGKKKFVAAISCLKRANYLAPFDWKILYNLGVVHLGMHQYASAFHFLSAAVNLNPKVPSLFMTLAIVLTHLEDYKNAQRAYEQAINMDQKDPTVALNFGIFCFKQGDQAMAARWFSNFETKLHNVRDQNTGILRIDTEVLEMAEKFRNLLNSGGEQESAHADEKSTRPMYLNKDPFDHEPVTLPKSTSGDGRTGLDTAASRRSQQSSLTVSSEPKLSLDPSETASVTSLSSRFPHHGDESNV